MITDKRISVVICCYGDEGNIEALYQRLSATLAALTPSYEIIYVNDASPDKSEVILRNLAAKDKNLTVVNHARNFGAQAAFTSGMIQATGDVVVLMDGDLQDPPELIEDFVRKWQEGYQVVYGVRAKREKSMGRLTQWIYHMFYVIFQKLAYMKVPLDAGEFSLMDRAVVNHINSMPERDRLIRGLRAWVGYKSIGIDYARPERFDGRKSVSTKGYIAGIRWARKAIFSFSFKPIEYITHFSLAMVILALLGILIYLVLFFVKGAPAGFMTLVVIVLFFSAVQLLGIAALGEYIGRIFEEVKGRPRFIIRDIVNDHRGKSEQ